MDDTGNVESFSLAIYGFFDDKLYDSECYLFFPHKMTTSTMPNTHYGAQNSDRNGYWQYTHFILMYLQLKRKTTNMPLMRKNTKCFKSK